MPTELEELVGFLDHGNTQIRQVAVAHLVGYSQSDPAVFKKDQMKPVRDLKVLIRDYKPIAENALTILINLSEDREVLQSLVSDDVFFESLMLRVTSKTEPSADEISMLMANMAKADEMLKILKTKRDIPKDLSKSEYAIDQLMDCFVKGADASFNKDASYDYLSYLFADLSTFQEFRDYFTKAQPRDENIVPLTKLIVFTEHKSSVRRQGVASTIKNISFDLKAHQHLLDPQQVNILPYILLPLMGSEEYSDEDTDGMLDELQLLEPDKKREPNLEILKTHLETLLLLTTERESRDTLRRVKVYPIVRECHLHVEDEEVREACDRVVQVIMRDEEGEGEDAASGTVHEIDDDDQIVDV